MNKTVRLYSTNTIHQKVKASNAVNIIFKLCSNSKFSCGYKSSCLIPKNLPRIFRDCWGQISTATCHPYTQKQCQRQFWPIYVESSITICQNSNAAKHKIVSCSGRSLSVLRSTECKVTFQAILYPRVYLTSRLLQLLIVLYQLLYCKARCKPGLTSFCSTELTEHVSLMTSLVVTCY